MSEPEPMTAETMCGKCRLPIHSAEGGLRHFGTFTAHSEHRCIELLRMALAEKKAECARLRAEPARADFTVWATLVEALKIELRQVREQLRSALKQPPAGTFIRNKALREAEKLVNQFAIVSGLPTVQTVCSAIRAELKRRAELEPIPTESEPEACPECKGSRQIVIRHDAITMTTKDCSRCVPEPQASGGSEPVHVYTSTACQHGLHDQCRLACKYCGARCNCSCGHAGGSESERITDTIRLKYLLDQICPSMFADHGLYALQLIAKSMRAAGSSKQLSAGISAIDAAILASKEKP